MRKCSKCGKSGHNKKTCKTNIESIPKRHKIRLQEQQKIQIPDSNGTIPKKGLWIISPLKEKIAGKILYIKKSGEIAWENVLGAIIITSPLIFKKESYLYLDLEPKMLMWNILEK